MTKIVYCGCSFMTSSYETYHTLKGKDWPAEFPLELSSLPENVQQELIAFNYHHYPSFLDIYSSAKGFDQYNLAQPGASNFSIRKQIDRALELQPNYVVVGATNPARLDQKVTPDLERQLIANYDYNYSVDRSRYYLQSGLDQLDRAGIKYVFIPGPMRICNWNNYNIVWPINTPEPWDTKPMNMTIANHNTLISHQQFSEVLLTLTTNWK